MTSRCCKKITYDFNNVIKKTFFIIEHMFSFDLYMVERSKAKDDNEIKRNYNNKNYIKKGKYK